MGVQGAISSSLFEELFRLYAGIGLVVGVSILGWLGFLLVRFRARRGPSGPSPSPPGTSYGGWIVAAMAAGISVVLFGLAFGTHSAITFLENPPSDSSAVHIHVEGIRWVWGFTYPNGAHTWGELRVPSNTTIILDVISRDVVHNFALPSFAIRVDAVPGRTTHLWFNATHPGTYPIVCAELCGVGHASMKGDLVVVPRSEWEEWVESLPTPPKTPSGGVNLTVRLTPEGVEPPLLRGVAGVGTSLLVLHEGSGPLALRVGDPFHEITPPLNPGSRTKLSLGPARMGLVFLEAVTPQGEVRGERSTLAFQNPQFVTVRLSEGGVQLDREKIPPGPVIFRILNKGEHMGSLEVREGPSKTRLVSSSPVEPQKESFLLWWPPHEGEFMVGLASADHQDGETLEVSLE